MKSNPMRDIMEYYEKQIRELESENERLKALVSNGESAIDTNDRLVEKIKKLMAERDRLKQRCEAYERAMKTTRGMTPCNFCKHFAAFQMCDYDESCHSENEDFEFDEARFANGGGAK